MTQSSAQANDEKISQHFSDLDISPQLKKGIKELGYVMPTPFQKGVFDNFQNGKNVLGEGQSNYGKSLAFSLPILAKIDPLGNRPQALIICETTALSELSAKECRALGRHLEIVVGTALSIAGLDENLPHIVISSVDDLPKINLDVILPSLHTVFFDGLSKEHADRALTLLHKALENDVQILAYGNDTLLAFNNNAKDLVSDAVLISNNDQPKIATAKHIYYQTKDTEPKPRALLAVLEIHKPKNALITCTEAQECDLLSRYLARYGYKTTIVSEEFNRQAMGDALRELQQGGDVDALICQSSLIFGHSLENVAFMINYDMFDRPQAYEHTTQFNKQAPSLERTIVNLLTSRELGYLGPIKAQCLIDFVKMPLPSEEEVVLLSAARIRDALNEEAREIELGQFEALTEKLLSDPSARPGLSLLLRNHLLLSTKPKKGDLEATEHREKRKYGSPYDRKRPERPDRRDRDGLGRAPKMAEHGDEGPARPNAAPEGIIRLYVTLGRRDGLLDLASLAQYLSDKSGVDLGHFSGSGMLRDTSAHIEVDEDVAEEIIKAVHDSERPSSDSQESQEPSLVICERARQSMARPNRRPMQRRRPNYQRR